MDLLSAVEHWSATNPHLIAQDSGPRALSYRELWAGANAVAAHLVRSGIEPGKPVVIRAQKEPEALIGFLGALLAGHPYVPVDSGLPDRRVAEIVALARAPLVLTPEEIAGIASIGGSVPARSRPPGEVQYLMFTSGSTGRPKGVPITRGNLTHFLTWMIGEHAFTPQRERFLDQAIYSFDLSVMSVYPALATGGTLVPIGRDDAADPARLFRTLAASRLTVWVSTPTFVQLCLAEPTFRQPLLPDLRRFLFCGEALPAATARALLERFPRSEIWNTYGPTEATVAITSVRIDRAVLDRYETLPIGRAAPGSRVVVVDEALRPVAEGDRGEILIAGPSVSPGYLDAPELTERAFLRWEGQWAYRTGDWGRLEGDLLFFDGRRDGQVKLHGYRIELGEVEANLRKVPGIRAAVAVVTSRNGTAGLTAFVVPEPWASGTPETSAASLKARLAETLPGYMVPRRIRFLEALPMTPNGKLDRQALVESGR